MIRIGFVVATILSLFYLVGLALPFTFHPLVKMIILITMAALILGIVYLLDDHLDEIISRIRANQYIKELYEYIGTCAALLIGASFILTSYPGRGLSFIILITALLLGMFVDRFICQPQNLAQEEK